MVNSSGCNYSALFVEYGIEYIEDANWLTVGVPDFNNKWILFLGLRVDNTIDVLNLVLPALKKSKAIFRVIKNSFLQYKLNGGGFGKWEIGKAVSVYTSSEKQAIDLVSEFSVLTIAFEGPDLYNACRVNNIVYVCYSKVSNVDGEVRVNFSIPKRMPFNIQKDKNRLRKTGFYLRGYIPVSKLYSNGKVDIYKAVDLKKMSWCVLKIAKKNTAEDENGRDMDDRIFWEKNVLCELSDIVFIPRCIDYFVISKRSCLVVEYFPGVVLYEKIDSIFKGGKRWVDIGEKIQHEILSCFLGIVVMIREIHFRLYVYRDISNSNIIISPAGKLCLIDFELSYSLNAGLPTPPFILGTHGFVAPEQINVSSPKIAEDIYSLGALLIYMLTDVRPVKIIAEDIEITKKNIEAIVPVCCLVQLAMSCLDVNPKNRPSINYIIDVVKQSLN
jgi:tRNA A-37 threonylcarbamoyl transferase component Bud32